MNIEYIIVVGLAAGYLIIAWRDGSLFVYVIAWLEDGMLSEHMRRIFGPIGKAIGAKLTQLLLCPLCLSPWTSLAIWSTLLFSQAVTQPGFVSLASVFASAAIAWGTYKRFNIHSTK